MPVASVEAKALTAESVNAYSKQRGEPAWLLERRLKALGAWNELPMPGKTDELWRRVDLSGLEIEPATERSGQLPILIEESDAAAKAGGFWGTLEQALKDIPQVLEAKWATEVYPAGAHGTIVDRKGGKFHALNQALCDGGYVLHLPKNAKTTCLFRCEFGTRPGKDGIYPHNLIVLEEGAEATVYEGYCSQDGDAGFCNPQTEIVVGPGAKLRYILLQDLAPGVVGIGAQQVRVMKHGHCTFASAHLGAKLSKDFMECEMAEPFGEAILYGLYYGLHEQQHHLTTYQRHVAPHCRSDLMYKGALDHKARAGWRGMIRLEADAQKTDAYQQNRTLLLSDDARIHSIPGLEILANDVRCTHGATAGQIDPTMLFYLLSRGITEFQARKMIMDGFFEEVILKFGLEEVIEPLRKRIDAKIAARS
ncbi:MAG: Fe-S cluster assembly protein SufD [Planctomycetota bacterium]|nr:Fe-S cluster assembly protein SufD [Planctomycetota bacterium]